MKNNSLDGCIRQIARARTLLSAGFLFLFFIPIFSFAQSADITTTGISPSPAVTNNSIAVNYTIINTGNTARTFSISAEIRYNSTLLATLNPQLTTTISPGNSYSNSFAYTIPSGWPPGTYSARTTAWSGTAGSSLILDFHDRNFTVQTEEIDADITTTAVSPNPAITGKSITVNYTFTNTGNTARTFGIGAEILRGSTAMAAIGQRITPVISPGDSFDDSFTYTIPIGWSPNTYTARTTAWTGTPGSSLLLDTHNRNFMLEAENIDADITTTAVSPNPVVPGNPITVKYTVTNTGNTAHTFGIGGEIRHGSALLAGLGPRLTPNLSPGDSFSDSLTYFIPVSWSPDTFIARTIAWTGTPGSSNQLDSHDHNFTVQDTTFILINGRLLYHTAHTGSSLAAPIDSLDGRIFMFTLPAGPLRNLTATLGVQNAMNPQFSPDGARIAFMAIPSGAPRERNSLEIFIYDLATETFSRLTNNNLPDEDPKFSPLGETIVFKRSNQIWKMSAGGENAQQLTFTADEKSSPDYSPDGSRIVYGSNSGSNADIWWMLANASASKLLGLSGIRDYLPVYRDSQNILFTRWESASDHNDKIFNYSIAGNNTKKFSFNTAGVNDSDPFPVNSSIVGFSSRRAGLDHDVYLADSDSGNVYIISGINTAHDDLGGCYSPFVLARKLALLDPVPFSILTVNDNLTLQVRGDSNGGVWNGASPDVLFQGPTAVTYSGLRDDGTNGDAASGDGIYSRTIALPAQAGVYSIFAQSYSTEGSSIQIIKSEIIDVQLAPTPTPTPTPEPKNSVHDWTKY